MPCGHHPVLTDDLSKKVLGCLIEVHTVLGPGLLEQVYEHCLEQEFRLRNIFVQRQVVLPVVYKGTLIENAYRIDLLVEKQIVLELKAVDTLTPIHEAQLMTYLKLAGLHHGFLVNFNTKRIADGIKSILI